VNNNPVPPDIIIPQPLSDQLSSPQSKRRFDLAQARPFIYKSVSEETRAAYTRAIKEFFQFIGHIHPTQVARADVIAYRDHLRIKKRRKANTIATKLDIIRSFFEYLKAGGVIPLNPASTKLVTPPELSSAPQGTDI
jgi:site-specific recombinase XerD